MIKLIRIINPITGETDGFEIETPQETCFVSTKQHLWPGVRSGRYPIMGYRNEWLREDVEMDIRPQTQNEGWPPRVR